MFTALGEAAFGEPARITRREAINQGLPYYYLGQPCRNGHRALRYTSTYQCTECTHRQTEDARCEALAQFNANGVVVADTRQAAIHQGLHFYYNGFPCLNKHYARRYTSSRICVECQQVANASRGNTNASRAQKTLAARCAKEQANDALQIAAQRREAQHLAQQERAAQELATRRERGEQARAERIASQQRAVRNSVRELMLLSESLDK